MCKAIVTPNKKHGQSQPESRNCQLPEWKDGWCHVHHPETIESGLVDELRTESKKMRLSENQLVGAWMRVRRADLFKTMLEEARRESR